MGETGYRLGSFLATERKGKVMSETERKYLLERVGDTNVAQMYCDDFANLDHRNRMLAYHLSQAAKAGRSIMIDQTSPLALSIKKMMERILTCSTFLSSEVVKLKVREYLKKFWINNGPYDHSSGRKILIGMSKEEFIKAFSGFIPSVEYWATVLCDPEYLPTNCNKTAADIIVASSSNFYSGLTFAEVKEWAEKNEKYPLNSTVVKTDKGIVERVWRCGNSTVESGLYRNQLLKINHHLRGAAKYATVDQKGAILSLVEFFETGDPKTFERFNIEWIGYNATVDFILGFIETYLDPRGAKGSFEGVVHSVDTDATAIMTKLGSEAAYFESRMPWDDKYKNPKIQPLDFRVVNIIFSCGDSGPMMPIGINLPNDDATRERYGSKSVMLKNVMGTYRKISGGKMLREFAWDEAEISLDEKWGDLDEDLHVAMHEVLGHASGKTLCAEDPHKLLPGCYATLEEARADLVALWLIFDQKLKEMGLVPTDDVGRVAYQSYVRSGGITQLRRVTEGDILEEDHMKNRQLVVHYIMDKSDAISVRVREGKTYFVVTDFEKMREKVGELLAEIMRIKAEGDLPAAKELIARYGTKINTKLRDEVVSRAKAINIPSYTAFVMPEPRLTCKDRVVDVELCYPQDLTRQMMNWDGFSTR